MMDRKWTPGPWIGGTWEGDDTCEVLDDNLMLVARTKTEPDAHLIASAPDLYDALQAMVDYCNAECGSMIYPAYQANQALEKARGETQ